MDTHNLKEKIYSIIHNNNFNASETEILIANIRQLIRNDKTLGKTVGPWLAELIRYYNYNKKQLENEYKKDKLIHGVKDKKSYWVKLGKGFLKIGHKPGGKNYNFETLSNENVNLVLTILSEKEGALRIGKHLKAISIEWLWLPLPNGKLPPEEFKTHILSIFELMKTSLEKGERIYIHCSAGLHRTGMISFAFLIYMGYTKPEAFDLLVQLRPLTAQQVGVYRMDWGKQFENINTK